MEQQLSFKSLFNTLSSGGSLHVMRIQKKQQKANKVVFLLHGSIESGKIFYNEKGKGLACFLAKHNCVCYIADMRGRGKSLPSISKQFSFGQHVVINEEIPACLEMIKEDCGMYPEIWIGHSWGGVLLLSYLARHKAKHPKKLILFGSKRRITVNSWEKIWKLCIFWYFMGYIGGLLLNYLPAKDLKYGAENEPYPYFKEVNKWLKPKANWIDWIDGFDYGKAILDVKLPASLFISAENDQVLGHQKDVCLLMHESGLDQTHLHLSVKNGNLHNYDHVNMLTHKDASEDHFPQVLEFLASTE